MSLKEFLKVCQRSEVIELINADTGVSFSRHEAYIFYEDIASDEYMLNKRVLCVRPAVEFDNEKLMAKTYLRVYFGF